MGLGRKAAEAAAACPPWQCLSMKPMQKECFARRLPHVRVAHGPAARGISPASHFPTSCLSSPHHPLPPCLAPLVEYCSEAHLHADRSVHGDVCRTLALIAAADAVEVSPKREQELIRLFPGSCKV